MKAVGLADESLITWHKKFHAHPIADPQYARENLVSLAETVVMLLLYLSLVILILHWLAVLGWVKSQTIPWALIEGATGALLYKIPQAFIDDRFNIFLAIVTTVVAAKCARRAFELTKADLHPKKKR